MKTIRTNCFETNSSSTHSITIETATESPAIDAPSLSEGTILYPGRINDVAIRAHFAVTPTHHDDRKWIFRASTRDTKTALLVHYIYSILEYEELDNDLLERVLDNIAAYAGYTEIKLGDAFFSHFTISRWNENEYGDEINKLLETVGISIQGNKVLVDHQAMGLLIHDIVFDDTKVLVDFSHEY